MKTLADLKRKMKIGSKWEAIHFNGWSPGVREIAEVKTNKIGFKTVRENGEIVTSWVDFPKAKNILFQNGWVEFWGDWYNHSKQQAEFVPIMKYRLAEV